MKIRLALITLAVASLAGAAHGGIWEPPPPGDFEPVWSPDSRAIVFVSTREPDALRVVSADGSGERPIPVSAGREPTRTTFAFSPDWYWIAAIVNSELVVSRPDGSQRHVLGGAGPNGGISWSPDGRRLTYRGPAAAEYKIFVANADGSERPRIVAEGYDPQWSPLGDRIAYLAPDSLRLISPDGTVSTEIIPRGKVTTGPIRWSPDGRWIAFVAPGGRLGVVSSSGGPRRIYATAASQFEWAPDSNRIAVVGVGELRILDTVSGASKLFARGANDPAWSPDGAQLAFAGPEECRVRSGIYRAYVGPAPVLQRLTDDCHIYGTAGPDVLHGVGLASVIVGRGGDDRLTAFGTDTLEGDDGNDVLTGGYYADIIDGGPGDDIVSGNVSGDRLTGGPGRDTIAAGGGRDVIYARDGERDVVSCGTNLTKGTIEQDTAYVDRIDVVRTDCEFVWYRGTVPPPKGRISLTIAVAPNGARPKVGRRSYTLTCRPAGGTLPNRARACSKLLKVQNPFAGIYNRVCTEIYGGPQRAWVTGVYGGKRVSKTFHRENGCGIADWNRVAFLFPIRVGIS